ALRRSPVAPRRIAPAVGNVVLEAQRELLGDLLRDREDRGSGGRATAAAGHDVGPALPHPTEGGHRVTTDQDGEPEPGVLLGEELLEGPVVRAIDVLE